MGEMHQREIDGVMVDLTDEDLAEYEADREGFTAQVIRDRETLDPSGPDTSEEAKRLIEERTVEEPEFDPTDFGDETISKPPKAGEK